MGELLNGASINILSTICIAFMYSDEAIFFTAGFMNFSGVPSVYILAVSSLPQLGH